MIRSSWTWGLGFSYLEHMKGHINHQADVLSRLTSPESSLQEFSANTMYTLYAKSIVATQVRLLGPLNRVHCIIHFTLKFVHAFHYEIYDQFHEEVSPLELTFD